MKDKIVQLMKSEGLTPSRLAEILEIQPSGISHLVSGRNKPSFELLQKILRRFPNINPYWLMLDEEDMYRRSGTEKQVAEANNLNEPISTPSSSIDLFSSPPSPRQPPIPMAEPHSHSSKIEQTTPKAKRVIILYEDGSCESFELK